MYAQIWSAKWVQAQPAVEDNMEYLKLYSNCRLCPRECGADRLKAQKGFCGEKALPRVGRASLHMWEEPCISGENGSGTVFFSGCNLRCCYCQNYSLSRGECGIEVDSEELSRIYLQLQGRGAHNINLVTAEHFAPHIYDSVTEARKMGLNIPVILNSNGYVGKTTLEILKDVIDIYLVDFKYMSPSLGRKYSVAEDYPSVAKNALKRMYELKGNPVFDDDGMMKSGVLVRHLCLPSHTEDSKKVLEYVFENYGEGVVLSIMSQYTPQKNCGEFEELTRRLTDKEYDEIIDFCLRKGVENAYIQDGESASESFIPEFNGEGVRNIKKD